MENSSSSSSSSDDDSSHHYHSSESSTYNLRLCTETDQLPNQSTSSKKKKGNGSRHGKKNPGATQAGKSREGHSKTGLSREVEKLRGQLFSLRNMVVQNLPPRRPAYPQMDPLHNPGFGPTASDAFQFQGNMRYPPYPRYPNYGGLPDQSAFKTMQSLDGRRKDKRSKKNKKPKKKSRSKGSCKPSLEILGSDSSDEESDTPPPPPPQPNGGIKRARSHTYTGETAGTSTLTNPNDPGEGEAGGSERNARYTVPEVNGDVESCHGSTVEMPSETPRSSSSAADLSGFNKGFKFSEAVRKNAVWQKIVDADNMRDAAKGLDMVGWIRNNQGLPQSARDQIFEYDRQAALEAKRTDKEYQMKKMLESITSSVFGGATSNLDVKKINGEGNGKLEIALRFRFRCPCFN